MIWLINLFGYSDICADILLPLACNASAKIVGPHKDTLTAYLHGKNILAVLLCVIILSAYQNLAEVLKIDSPFEATNQNNIADRVAYNTVDFDGLCLVSTKMA